MQKWLRFCHFLVCNNDSLSISQCINALFFVESSLPGSFVYLMQAEKSGPSVLESPWPFEHKGILNDQHLCF